MNTENNGGFTQNTCDIKGLDEYEGYFVQIIAKNENYIAWKVDSEGKKEKILATIPDLISILNLKASMFSNTKTKDLIVVNPCTVAAHGFILF